MRYRYVVAETVEYEVEVEADDENEAFEKAMNTVRKWSEEEREANIEFISDLDLVLVWSDDQPEAKIIAFPIIAQIQEAK